MKKQKKLCQECNEPVPTAVWNTTQIKQVACATCREEYHSVRHLYRRDYDLQRRYGLSLLDYMALLIRQRGKCGMCRGAEVNGPKRAKWFFVAHDHKTGKVRRLLCHPCNTFVGILESHPVISDGAELGDLAVEYIENYRET